MKIVKRCDKPKCWNCNQLISYVFSYGKLIPIQVEMAQSEISDNDYMIFLLPPTLIQVQSDNDEKKKKKKKRNIGCNLVNNVFI